VKYSVVLAAETEVNEKKVTPKSAISFGSVSKRYHKELPLLENITFEVNYGELFVIIGPSGSGKSTILQMASGLLYPDSGHITINEKQVFPRAKEVKRNKARSEEVDSLRRSLISFVPQEDFLFESLSVFENVALALDLCGNGSEDKNYRDSGARRALEDVGIGQLGDRMINQISAGERRRCAIARALVRNPSILIADEPTASLDIEKTKELMKYLKAKQNQGGSKIAILIASHDVLELEPFADKIYEIRNFALYTKN
jgi:ABC-type multidrug transport system ATPase subunit